MSIATTQKPAHETTPDADARTCLLLVYGPESCKQWLKEFARHVGVPKTYVFDLAMKDMAEKHNFPPMPPRSFRDA